MTRGTRAPWRRGRGQARADLYRIMAALPHRYMDCSSNVRAVLCEQCQLVADFIRAHPEFVS